MGSLVRFPGTAYRETLASRIDRSLTEAYMVGEEETLFVTTAVEGWLTDVLSAVEVVGVDGYRFRDALLQELAERGMNGIEDRV